MKFSDPWLISFLTVSELKEHYNNSVSLCAINSPSRCRSTCPCKNVHATLDEAQTNACNATQTRSPQDLLSRWSCRPNLKVEEAAGVTPRLTFVAQLKQPVWKDQVSGGGNTCWCLSKDYFCRHHQRACVIFMSSTRLSIHIQAHGPLEGDLWSCSHVIILPISPQLLGAERYSHWEFSCYSAQTRKALLPSEGTSTLLQMPHWTIFRSTQSGHQALECTCVPDK